MGKEEDERVVSCNLPSCPDVAVSSNWQHESIPPRLPGNEVQLYTTPPMATYCTSS